jgi:hypothetical protein
VGTLAQEAEWKDQEAQNDTVEWGVDDGLVTPPEEGWPGISIDEEHRVTWPSPSNEGSIHVDDWPSIEGGVEVTVEVCSDAMELQREYSTCRFCGIGHCSVINLLSFLCHSPIGTSFGSCVPCHCSRGELDKVIV